MDVEMIEKYTVAHSKANLYRTLLEKYLASDMTKDELRRLFASALDLHEHLDRQYKGTRP